MSYISLPSRSVYMYMYSNLLNIKILTFLITHYMYFTFTTADTCKNWIVNFIKEFQKLLI
jgi:hypothetical protein